MPGFDRARGFGGAGAYLKFVTTAALISGVLSACGAPDNLTPEGSTGPTSPAEVLAQDERGGLRVSWTDRSEDEEGFNVFRRQAEVESNDFGLIATLEEDSEDYLDTTPEVGQSYVYAVQALGQNSDSERVTQSNAPVTFTGDDDSGDRNGDGDDSGTGDGDDTGDDDPGTGDGNDGGADDGSGDGSADDESGDGGTRDDSTAGGVIAVTSTSEDSSGGECTLRHAIEAANLDEAHGACTGGSGTDTILLPESANFILTTTYGQYEGPTGLPSISSSIRIEGNGSSIGREERSELFRIMHVASNGELELFDTTIDGGDADDNGGGGVFIAAGGSAHISGATFGQNGPSAVHNAGELRMEDSTLLDNGNDKTPAYALHNLGSAVLRRVEITANHAVGIVNEKSATLDLLDSSVTENLGASAFIGGIINNGSLNANGTKVNDNTGYDAIGGIVNNGELTFEGGSISENFGVDHGAGLVNQEGASATLTNTVISGNLADFNGAGVVNSGKMTLEDVTVEDNRSTAYGAGISSSSASGELVISGNSIIRNNDANWDGAGIYVTRGSVVVAGDTLIDGNQAGRNGGGIYIASSGHVGLEGDVAVTGNAADSDGDATGKGGGVYVESNGLFEQDGARIKNNTPDDVFIQETSGND